jgi:tetratricopeptide (TPR) repeat protein
MDKPMPPRAKRSAKTKSLATGPITPLFPPAAPLPPIVEEDDDDPRSPRWQAQELAYDAMEAETDDRALDLAKRALAIDPDCVDALATINEITAENPKNAIAGLKKAVEAGERSLGSEFFKQNKGYFWGLIETRPYMRARMDLAELERSLGHGRQAMGHYEALLELNPNDNQGVRYPLLGCYLAHGELIRAAKLLETYKDDGMAVFVWGRVLERFLAGDRKAAVRELKHARGGNPFVELFFSAQMSAPDQMSDTYTLGSKEEALICFDYLGAAWAKNREAMFWLLDRIYGPMYVRGKSKPGTVQ